MDQNPKKTSSTLRYFSATEFNLCVPSCCIEDMDQDFLRKLDYLRELCGFPLVLSCAYRSKEYDISKHRSGNSMHCKGRAVDILCRDSHKRAQIVFHASFAGLHGIGVSKSFVHVDDRADWLLWTYD